MHFAFVSDCGHPVNISNGYISVNSTTFGAIASVHCDTGYETSNTTITCQDTGVWSTSMCIIKSK